MPTNNLRNDTLGRAVWDVHGASHVRDGPPSRQHGLGLDEAYPLVNIQITMENHHVSWVNQL